MEGAPRCLPGPIKRPLPATLSTATVRVNLEEKRVQEFFNFWEAAANGAEAQQLPEHLALGIIEDDTELEIRAAKGVTQV
jgi:hypothetical protein